MNVEIEINDLKIKVQYTDKKHVDKLILAAVNYMNGGSFEEVYSFVEKPKEQPKKEKKFIPEVDGVKTFKDGSQGFKTKYFCTCGHDGIKYAQLDDDYITCHSCNTKLNLSPVASDEAHDEDFNYFLAY